MTKTRSANGLYGLLHNNPYKKAFSSKDFETRVAQFIHSVRNKTVVLHFKSDADLFVRIDVHRMGYVNVTTSEFVDGLGFPKKATTKLENNQTLLKALRLSFSVRGLRAAYVTDYRRDVEVEDYKPVKPIFEFFIQ